MPPSNPLPPKENALFKRILVSYIVNIQLGLVQPVILCDYLEFIK